MITSHFTLTGKFRLLAVLSTFLFTSAVYAQSCNATFSVQNDRNVGSADEDGAQFIIDLTNQGSQNTSYSLRAVFLDESCATPNKSNLGSNVRLDVAFMGSSIATQEIREIRVSRGQTVQLKVDVSVPSGTPFNRWSCIQLEAFDSNCNVVAGSQLLRVFVPDPSEE